MVACLEKSEGNIDFHEIVDFLTASSIHYSLTILLRTFVNEYSTPAHTKKVFTNMKINGKDFSGRVSPLFASMLAPPVVEGEGSGQPSEPQPTHSTTQPRIEEQILVTESSSPQNTQSPRKALQEDTQCPQTSMPILNIADEAVFKGWDGKVLRATTTAASLDTAHASGDKPRVLALEQSKTAQDLVIRKLKKKVRKLEKKLRARTLGMKLFKIGTSKRKSLDEEYVSKQGRKSDKTKPMFDDSDFAELDVDNAMENVEGDAETQGRNTAEQTTTAGDTVNTASIDVSAAGPSNVSTADPSTSTAGDIFKDEMMTIADTLVAIRSTRPRTTSVIIHDVEEEPRRSTPAPTAQPSSKDKGKALMVEPKKPSKNPRKAQIQMDEELAIRLHEEEKAELERMQRERAAQEEASNAALIAEFDNVQARMEADALLAARLQEKEREQFSMKSQASFLWRQCKRKRFFAAQRAEQIRNKPPTRTQLRSKMITYLKNIESKSSKEEPRAQTDEREVIRQKIKKLQFSEEQLAEKEKELSEKELHKLLVVVPVEEVYVEALQVKYPIIDQEVYSKDIRRYWRIIRVRNHTEAYQIFADMLKKFDRDDLVELKRLFEPDKDDTLWKLQRYMHDPLEWRLYDTCGVHHVSTLGGHVRLKPRHDKDSGGNIPPVDMEPIHTPVADPSGTGAKYQVDKTQSTRLRYRSLTKNEGKTSFEAEPDTEPLKLQTYADIQAFLLSDDELDKEINEEEVLDAGDDMDEDPQDDAEVRAPSPGLTQPDPSYMSRVLFNRITEKQSEQHEEAAVSYADLKASIDQYYDENIAHRDQTDKLVEASMSSLDRSSTTISDLYKGLDVITQLLKDINNVVKDDPATNQKLNEATKTFARISSKLTKVLSLV
ncbi:hypothetical protein Tco_0694267 [Tanacetum coccineum]